VDSYLEANGGRRSSRTFTQGLRIQGYPSLSHDTHNSVLRLERLVLHKLCRPITARLRNGAQASREVPRALDVATDSCRLEDGAPVATQASGIVIYHQGN
jgi:hypothetical protein